MAQTTGIYYLTASVNQVVGHGLTAVKVMAGAGFSPGGWCPLLSAFGLLAVKFLAVVGLKSPAFRGHLYLQVIHSMIACFFRNVR